MRSPTNVAPILDEQSPNEATAPAAPAASAEPMPGGGRRPTRRIAYFVNVFPNVIETMIYREVIGLRAKGFDVKVFSIRRPGPNDVPPEVADLCEGTTYVLPAPVGRVVGRHLAAFLTAPLVYLRTLLRVACGTHDSWRDRLRSLGHFGQAITILPEVRAANVEHLHAHWATGPATCAMTLAPFLGLRFSMTAHAYDVWRDRLLLPEKTHDASFVVTCSEYNREHLVAEYRTPPTRVHTVHHGVDTALFGEATHRRNDVPVILAVGRLVAQKGYDRLLSACGKLETRGVPFSCVIVGDGPLLEELRAQARSLGIEAHVDFRGRLFQHELRALYAESDLFALLCVPAPDNDRDGIPNVMIEAMATGLPVVSTRFAGVPELVEDGVTGRLVEADDADAVADAIAALLSNPGLRTTMGARCRARVAEGFTIDASVDKLANVFVEGIPLSTARRDAL